MIKTYSPLRYPGGKAKIYNRMASIILNNNLYNGTYIEPYVGGAGLAMKLLLLGDMKEIYINDYDYSIYAVWECILNHSEELCNLIKYTEITIDEWKRQKEIQNNKNIHDIITLGFSTFFLNRTNHSGIIKGGIIGGYNQNGNYKMDCRFNKEDLIMKIQRIAEHRNRIHLYNLDAIDFIELIKPKIPDNSIFYLDPPYYSKGPELYTNFYTHNDHVKLAQYMSNNNDYKWLITYDDNDEIKIMYEQFNQMEYKLSYTAQKKYKGTELIIYNKLVFNEATI